MGSEEILMCFYKPAKAIIWKNWKNYYREGGEKKPLPILCPRTGKEAGCIGCEYCVRRPKGRVHL